MAAVVKLDTIQDAVLDYQGWKVVRIRTAVISNLDTSVPALVLEDAFVELQLQTGITYGSGYPSNPSWRLQAIKVVPMSGNIARLILIYSTVDWGQTTYLVRDTTYTTTIDTQLMPGPDKTPFRVSWQGGGGTDAIPSDTVTLRVDKTIRSLEIVYHNYGSPPTAPRPFVNYVNNDTFLGMDPGYWRFAKFTSDVARYNSSFIISAEVITLNDEDWRKYGILQSRTTGRFVDVGDPSDTSTPLGLAKSRPYQYGLIYPQVSGEEKNGLICAGPYQMTSFASIFSGIEGSATGI